MENKDKFLEIEEKKDEAGLGNPEELIGAALFLASDDAAGFVNGIVLPVDGGYSAFSGV